MGWGLIFIMKSIDPSNQAPKELLKSLYMDVLKGYSVGKTKSFGKIYAKHLDALTSGEIDEVYRKFLNKATGEGLPTEEEQTVYLKEQEVWTREEDEKLGSFQEMLNNLHRTKKKLFLKSQIDNINEEIGKTEKELAALNMKKAELLGFTAEKYANKKLNEYYMYVSLHKDADLKEKFFEEEEYEEVSFSGLNELILFYNDISKYHNEYNLKRVSLSPFFLNYFYLCDDNPLTFFGKPVVELTYLQTELFGYARYFKNLMSNCKNQPDNELYDEPEKLIDYLEGQKNAEKIHKQLDAKTKQNQGSTIIGATAEDLKIAGIKSDAGMAQKSLGKAAAKKGGSLSMKDMIELHGA